MPTQALLRALRLPAAAKQSAAAFRSVCVRCAPLLKDAAALSRLMELAAEAVTPAPAPGQPAPLPQGRCLQCSFGQLFCCRNRCRKLHVWFRGMYQSGELEQRSTCLLHVVLRTAVSVPILQAWTGRTGSACLKGWRALLPAWALATWHLQACACWPRSCRASRYAARHTPSFYSFIRIVRLQFALNDCQRGVLGTQRPLASGCLPRGCHACSYALLCELHAMWHQARTTTIFVT